MVFEIILENPFEFQQIFKTIGKITDCFNMEFNDEGIFVQAMDNSHISLISMHSNTLHTLPNMMSLIIMF